MAGDSELQQCSVFCRTLNFQAQTEREAPINQSSCLVPYFAPSHLSPVFPPWNSSPSHRPSVSCSIHCIRGRYGLLLHSQRSAGVKQDRGKIPEGALQSKSRGERLRSVPGSSQELPLCPGHTGGGTGQWLVGWLLHSSLMTKENQLPVGLTRTCELFSLREDTSCWGPQESLRVAEKRGINELCHFAVTWKRITTYHKQHLGDLTVQIGIEWETSKPCWSQWLHPKPELPACSLQEVHHHNCNSRDKQHTHL